MLLPISVPQLLLAMAASLGYMTIGLVRGFSSPGVPSMKNVSPELVPTEDIISWVSAIPPLGAMLGSLAVGPLLQRLGRKRSLMLSAPIFFVAWTLIAYANSPVVLIVARLLSGFCVGLVTPSAQVYVSESSHAAIRGILGSLPALFMAGGVLISYILGTWLPWNQLALASAAVPALLFFVLIPLPESPAWLLSQGRIEEAKQSLKWLHRTADVAAIELNVVQVSDGKGGSIVAPAPLSDKNSSNEVHGAIKDKEKEIEHSHRGINRCRAMSIDEHMEIFPDEEIVEIAVQERRKSIVMKKPTHGDLSFKAIFRRPVLYPFGLSIALLGFQQVSGIDTIIFYTVEIFQTTDGAINDYFATILVGAVQLICTMLSVLVIDRAGRRPLLLLSGSIMTLSMAMLGTYFYLQLTGSVAGLGLLPVSSLLLFMVGFSVGFSNIPFLLMGELLPIRQRSVLSSVAGSFNLGAMFLVIKTYPLFKDWLGAHVIFWIYAGLCLASCVFVAVLLPETKGKTLEEIENYFEGKHQQRKIKKRLAAQMKETTGTSTNDCAENQSNPDGNPA